MQISRSHSPVRDSKFVDDIVVSADAAGTSKQVRSGLGGLARNLSAWLGWEECQPVSESLHEADNVEQRLNLHVDAGWGEMSRRWHKRLCQLPGYQEVKISHLECRPRPRHGRCYCVSVVGLPSDVKEYVGALRTFAARTPAWHVDLRQA